VTTNLPDFNWPGKLPRTCSKEMLFLGVKVWATGGSEKELAEILNVPVHAVKRFTNLPGWHFVVRQLRQELDREIENRLQRNVRLALTQLEDRLEHGNKYIDKDAREQRRPLTASELSSITAILFDRKAVARKIVDGIPDEPTDARESLAAIANLLRKHKTFEVETPKTITIEDDGETEIAA
jgi:hypothetical protein